MNINQSKKGEVASLLAIISMVMIGVGLFVGTQLARQTSPIQKDPFAQSRPLPQQQNEKVLADKPSVETPQVCFPLGTTQPFTIGDPLCTGHLYPQQLEFSIVKNDAGTIVSDRFNGLTNASSRSDNIKTNPYVHQSTKKNQLVKITGTTCLSSNGKPRDLNIARTEIFLSPLYVREWFYPGNGTQENANEDINDVLSTLIQSDKAAPTGQSIKTLVQNSPYCEYVAIKDGSGYRINYSNEKNPLVFEFNPAKQQIKAKVVIALNTGKFDRKACGLYIHLRSDKTNGQLTGSGIDVYNLGYVSLKDIFDLSDIINDKTGETLKDICEPVTTPTISDSPTPSVTETIPSDTPIPTPTVAACFGDCSADETKVTCGDDPTSETPIQMKCYQVSNSLSQPRFPTGFEDSTNDSTNGSQDSNRGQSGFKVDGPCQSDSQQCRCLPARCEDPAKDCSSQALACTIPTITEVQRPSDTPIPSPSETPIPQACTFKSLAFIDECTSYRFETDQNGNDRLICTQIKPFDLTKITARFQENGKFLYGMSNNLQLANVGKDRDVSTLPVDRARIKGLYEDSIYANIRNFIDSDHYRLTHKKRESASVTARLWDMLPFNLLPGQSITDRSIKINPDPRTNYQNEIYANGDVASVQIALDGTQYKVVPDGTWFDPETGGSSQGNPASPSRERLESRYSSCLNSKLNTNECNVPANSATSLNDIAGLNMRCGEDIEYGWTIMKCKQDVDYVFVVDVSTSMNLPEANYSGTKLDVIKDQIVKYIGNIKDSNSRISVITFGRSVVGKLDFTNSLQQAQSYVQSIPATAGGINREGTCIDCGANEALRLVNARSDVSRNPVVIFMTDGIPTWRMGDNQAKTEGFCQRDYSLCIPAIQGQVNNLKAVAGLTLASVGYGKIPANDQEVNFNLQLLKVIDMLGQEGWKFSTNSQGATDLYKGKIAFAPVGEIYGRISDRLNSCNRAQLASTNVLKSKDINGDGIINSIEYFLIIDSYFKEGNNLKEDINGDKVVNAMDLSEILRDFGTVIPTSGTGNQVEENVQ